MIYWQLWGIGWAFVLATRIFMLVADENYWLEKRSFLTNSIIFVLMSISICLVGGIANGLWLGYCLGSNPESPGVWTEIFAACFIGFIPAGLTYAVGYGVLGLYQVENKIVHTIFVLIFLVSIAGWTIPITEYNRNIEVKVETGISKTEDKELYYFCNIPVQKISGEIEGSVRFGTGKITGDISTNDTLPYWYDDGTGDALFNSVDANDARIDFLEEGETPFIRIITHYSKEIEINHNTGEEKILDETWWKEYEFHVPIEIMQYNLG